MKFGAVPIGEADGGVAVHSIRKNGFVLKKGTRIGPAEIAAMQAAGIAQVTVARLEPGDVSEDAAAAGIAAALAGGGGGLGGPLPGRGDLFAERAGGLGGDRAAGRRA